MSELISINEGGKANANGLLGELERLVAASEAGDFGVVLEDGPLSREAAAAIRLLNKAIGNYRAAMENGLMKYKRDLTCIKLMQAKIDELAHWYMTILDAIPFPITVTDANMNWAFVNKAVEAFLGMKREDMLGKPCSNWNAHICKTDDCGIACAKRGLKQTFFTHQGSSYQVDVEILKNLEGQTAGFIEVVQDITKVETMARRQADAANEAKSIFLANMSHEMRTPMNAVLGMLRLAQSDDLPAMSAPQADYVFKAEQSAKTLLRVINDILDFSKIEAGRLEMEKAEFSISHVLSQMTDMFTPQFKEKGLNFDVSAPASLPPRLLGDPLRLGQVLLNLISNAIKFTEKGGVSLSVSEIGRQDRQVTLQFTVRDTGIGMNQEQIKVLFNPFTQGDLSTTRKYGGTGLGLTISQELVRLMGGEIWCASEPGRGATFHMTAEFDLVPEGAEPGSARQGRPEIKAKPRDLSRAKPILLVEDNEMNQLIARKFLEKKGLKVEVANNGREALDMLQAGDYELVFMDIQMPVMDGLSCTMEIRKIERFRDLPIIAMTAHAMSGDREKSLGAGMNDHITKPIDVNMLYAALEKWIGASHLKEGSGS